MAAPQEEHSNNQDDKSIEFLRAAHATNLALTSAQSALYSLVKVAQDAGVVRSDADTAPFFTMLDAMLKPSTARKPRKPRVQRPRDPLRPKKPFSNITRAKNKIWFGIRREREAAGQTALSKDQLRAEVAMRWAALPADERAEHEAIRAEALAKYKADMTAYNARGADDELDDELDDEPVDEEDLDEVLEEELHEVQTPNAEDHMSEEASDEELHEVQTPNAEGYMPEEASDEEQGKAVEELAEVAEDVLESSPKKRKKRSHKSKDKAEKKSQFSGGLETLFEDQKTMDIDLKPHSTIFDLLEVLKAKVKGDLDLFLQDDNVRPGVLVLINDCDWELFESDYEVQSNDVVHFASTLHGG